MRREENIFSGDRIQLLPLGAGELPRPGEAGGSDAAGESGEAGGRWGVSRPGLCLWRPARAGGGGGQAQPLLVSQPPQSPELRAQLRIEDLLS